jgi:hypothetical protein
MWEAAVCLRILQSVKSSNVHRVTQYASPSFFTSLVTSHEQFCVLQCRLSCIMNGVHSLERNHNWTKLRFGRLKQTLPRDWTHAQHAAHQLYRSDCVLCTWGFNCYVTNSTSNDILKSFDSTYSKELAPNAGAVCSLRLLSFTLQVGKWSPMNGAQAPKMSGQPRWRHNALF